MSRDINWVLEKLNNQNRDTKDTKPEGHRVKSIPVDRAIRYCPKCKSCWERIWVSGEMTINNYKDFPHLGKEKIECPSCRKKKKTG